MKFEGYRYGVTDSLYVPYLHGTDMAGRQLYFEDELTEEWKAARDAAIEWGKLRNHRKTTKRNDRKLPLWVALDFQDQGVNSPSEITRESWLELVERYRNGRTRSGNELEEKSIKKRKEGLVQILKANQLSEILIFVEVWKPRDTADDVKWWDELEMEAMNEFALKSWGEGKYPQRVIAHLLFYSICPRIKDAGLFKWEYLNLETSMIFFPATKNSKRCQHMIEQRFIPVFAAYKEYVQQFEGGDVYLFPRSMGHKSGSERNKSDTIGEKSIRKWLEWIRNNSRLPDGTEISPYPSHSYRHTMAMRYLNAGQRYEDVSIILGDTIATIEKHYSELIFTPANKLAFEKAHPRCKREKAIGTAQPEWMEREVGFRTPTTGFTSVQRNGVLDVEGTWWTLGNPAVLS